MLRIAELEEPINLNLTDKQLRSIKRESSQHIAKRLAYIPNEVITLMQHIPQVVLGVPSLRHGLSSGKDYVANVDYGCNTVIVFNIVREGRTITHVAAWGETDNLVVVFDTLNKLLNVNLPELEHQLVTKIPYGYIGNDDTHQQQGEATQMQMDQMRMNRIRQHMQPPGAFPNQFGQRPSDQPYQHPHHYQQQHHPHQFMNQPAHMPPQHHVPQWGFIQQGQGDIQRIRLEQFRQQSQCGSGVIKQSFGPNDGYPDLPDSPYNDNVNEPEIQPDGSVTESDGDDDINVVISSLDDISKCADSYLSVTTLQTLVNTWTPSEMTFSEHFMVWLREQEYITIECDDETLAKFDINETDIFKCDTEVNEGTIDHSGLLLHCYMFGYPVYNDGRYVYMSYLNDRFEWKFTELESGKLKMELLTVS